MPAHRWKVNRHLVPLLCAWLCGCSATTDNAADSDGPAACAARMLCADGKDAGTDAAPGEAPDPALDVVWTAERARQQQAQGAVLFVDARAQAAFENEHIAGAYGLPVDSLRVELMGVPAQVPPAAAVAEAFAKAGIREDMPIVVYAEESDLAAARLVWTFVYLGHGSVHMLDGGLTAWRALGHDVQPGASAAESGEYRAAAARPAVNVDAQWVLQRLEDPNVILIDARSPAEYAAAHIPGAINLDWRGNVAQSGVLRARAELEARHAEVSRAATVVAYCQTGSRASMAWLTLVHLGYEDARLFDGSMAEWTLDSTRPLE